MEELLKKGIEKIRDYIEELEGQYVLPYNSARELELKLDTLENLIESSYKKEINMFDFIRQWSRERDLDASSPMAQYTKLIEEVGELGKALVKGDFIEISDGIGDCVVVLTILAQRYNLTIEKCIEYTYQEIKDRVGEVRNGIFIKEE